MRSRSAKTGRLSALERADAELDDMAQHRDVELAEQELGQRSSGHTRCGLPSRRPFEHVAGIGEAVLLHAGQVGMTGPRLGERRGGRTVLRPGRHLLLPLVGVPLPLGVLDLDGDRRAERATVTNAAHQRQLVLLETHARAAAVAKAAPRQLGLQVFDSDRQTRGEALDHDDERRSVRLAGGEEAQHHPTVPAEVLATRT